MYYVIYNIFFRRLNSGTTSNIIDTAKLQVKNVVLNQWKLITVLKSYVSKFAKDNAFEKALNKEFIVFLQKIDLKVYSGELIRPVISNSNDYQETKDKTDQTHSVSTNVLKSLKTSTEKADKEGAIPKWKVVSKSVISKVSTFCKRKIW